MIPVHPRFTRYLGFAVEEEDGSKSYYSNLMLPLGINAAARVLTRVMKSPIERWRKQSIVVLSTLTMALCARRTRARP